jgi:rubrerythrin
MATSKETGLHYVELLNTVALQEARADVFLKVWADKTPDPELRACLSLVAEREKSHYDVFKRRIEELGYTMTEEGGPDFSEHLRVHGSDITDVEKVRWQQSRQENEEKPTIQDRYKAAISDETIDGLTRSMIKWFADEEDDSVARISEAFARIKAQAG